MKNLKECTCCYGEGRLPIGNRYVSRDMALDAGMPELEGMFYETEYAKCSKCGGNGFIEDEAAKEE